VGEKIMKIACFGDSLTFGSVGYSYIKFMNPADTVINKGVNGDTTVCAYNRLKNYIENPAHTDMDVYVIAIGTNDLLIPYLAGVSPTWHIIMSPRAKYKKCISDDAVFKAEYQKYIELAVSKNKPIIAVGLPVLQLKGYPFKAFQKRNRIIQRLAADYQIPYVDAASLQRHAVKTLSYDYSWKRMSFLRLVDGVAMLLLPFSKDWFSQRRRLELTVDGVHYNTLSAKLIGNAISKAAAESAAQRNKENNG
jgi:lysophospholipase L1-like esterase